MPKEATLVIKPQVGDSIPFDVATTLIRALGSLYPNSKMGPGDPDGGFTLILDPAYRVKEALSADEAAAVKDEPDDDPGSEERGLIGWRDGTITATTDEDYRRRLAEWAYLMLTGVDGAVNYVAQEVRTPEGRPFVVTAAWSKEQTPHELRMRAEGRAESAEAEVGRLRAELAALKEGAAAP